MKDETVRIESIRIKIEPKEVEKESFRRAVAEKLAELDLQNIAVDLGYCEIKKGKITMEAKDFIFGQWLLIDGICECQFIHPDGASKDNIVVDIKGDWISTPISRITINKKHL
jgi:hypothetical protein